MLLNGCEKETIVPLTEAVDTQEHEEAPAEVDLAENNRLLPRFIPRDSLADEVAYFAKELGKRLPTDKSNNDMLSRILAQDPLVINDPGQALSVYSYLIPTDGNENAKENLYNLVLTLANSEILLAQIYGFELTKHFRQQLASGDATLADYTGEIQVLPFTALSDVTAKDGMSDCFSLPVVNAYVGNLRGVDDLLIIYNPGSVPGGPGNPGGTNGPVGGNGPSGPDTGEPQICERITVTYFPWGGSRTTITVIDCETGEPINEAPPLALRDDDVDASPKNKVSDADCNSLLNLLGIVTGYETNLTSWQEQSWESLTSGTAFQHSQILQGVVNLDDLRSCSNGSSAKTCIREQAVDYCNDVLQSNASGRLFFSVPEHLLTDEQLILVTEALFVADTENNNMLVDAVQATIKNVSKPFVRQDIGQAIGLLAKLRVKSGSSTILNELAEDLLTFANEVSESQANYLASYPDMLRELARSSFSGSYSRSSVVREIMNVGNRYSNPSRAVQNMAGLYRCLNNKRHFFQRSSDQNKVFINVDNIFENMSRGDADALFGDYSRISGGQRRGLPFLAPYIAKAIVRGGIGAVIDFSVQFGFEYTLGGHNSLEDAWANFDVDWFSLGASMIEANTNPKYGAYLSGGSAALSSIYNTVVRGDELTTRTLLEPAVQFAIGYFTSRLGEYVGEISQRFTKYGFSSTFNGLTQYFGPATRQLVRNSSSFRREMMLALWKEVDRTPTFERGKYIEAFLSYKRYYGNGVRWSNVMGETGGPVDFYSLDNSLAISVKSHRTLANISTSEAFKQIYKAMSTGINVDGNLVKFNKLQIDFVVKEGPSPAQIQERIRQLYSNLEKQINTNRSDFPLINLRSTRLEDILTIKIDFGYD